MVHKMNKALLLLVFTMFSLLSHFVIGTYNISLFIAHLIILFNIMQIHKPQHHPRPSSNYKLPQIAKKSNVKSK